jgi:uncharacterized repeat protein (TIGR01451 family)
MGRTGVRVCAWVGCAVVFGVGAGVAQPVPTLKVSYAGFADVNGNGQLDCGEPVTVVVAYATNNSGTPALSGTLVAPYAGSSGLSFLPGSAVIDQDLTVGCQAVVTTGGPPEDAAAQVAFTCPADPQDNNSWTVVVRYQGTYDSGGAPAFDEVAHVVTSDGRSLTADAPSAGGAGAAGGVVPAGVCAAAANAVAVTKTAAGPATPGSVLLYTLAVRDTSGEGDGGVQLVETVPANTVFDAAASSPGWACDTGAAPAGAGTVCRNPLGNVPPGGTVTSFFAVTIATPLAAGVTAIGNTACARFGPVTVGGCGSVVTPAAGVPVLQVTKSLASGTAAPGATLAYLVTVANAGNQGAAGVTLEETVPASTTLSAAASAAGWACVPGPQAGASCTLAVGDLPAGAAAARGFAVVVADPLPAGVTAIGNTACAAAPGVAQGCDTVAVPAAGTVALKAGKVVKSGGGVPGTALEYDVSVENVGDEGAAAVVASETVPALTSFVAAASTAGWACAPGTGAGSVCTLGLGAVAAGQTVHADFAVAVENPLPSGAGAIGNTVCFSVGAAVEGAGGKGRRVVVGRWRGRGVVGRPAGGRMAGGRAAGAGMGRGGGAGEGSGARGAAGVSSWLADDGAACATVTTPAAGQAVLRLVKTYGGGPAAAGATLAFALAASNAGNEDAAGVVVTETVPAHTTFAAAASTPGWACGGGGAAGAACTLALGTLAAGAPAVPAAVVTFGVVVDAVLPAGVTQIGNAACLADTAGDAGCGQAATPAAVEVAATLAAAVAGRPGGPGGGAVAFAGDEIDYTLVLVNPSGAMSATAEALVAAVPLDPHLVLEVGSVAVGAVSGAGTVVVTAGNGAGDGTPAVAVGSLAAGGSVTVTFRARVAAVIPAALQAVSAQAAVSGGNFAATVSSDPAAAAPLQPTTTPVGHRTAVAAVPALGPVGAAALVAVLAAASLVRMRRGAWGRRL